jgi:hypothetical protein
VKCRYCGHTLTDPVSIAAGAGPVCRDKCEGRYHQETVFTMSDGQIRNNRDAAAYDDRRQCMIHSIDNHPRVYTALDLVPHLGETVMVRQTNHDQDWECVLCAVVKDGVMVGNPHGDRNDEWSPLSIDEFNTMCRWKDNDKQCVKEES